ncbi:MAG: hypothetical protein AAB465_01230 [Patescibacteria group bacterium]
MAQDQNIEQKKEEIKIKIPDNQEKVLASWSFPEYRKLPRTRLWYISMIVVLLAMIIYSLFVGNLLFLLIIILGVAIFILNTRQAPRNLECVIAEDGINVGSSYYAWKDIKSFRLVYRPPQVKLLYLDLKNVLLTDFSVPIENENPLKIREILKNYLLEDLSKEEENIVDRLNRWFKL